jgi:uncharacterized MAPEG superfamily protein
MNATINALLIYVSLMIVLLVIIASLRTKLALTGTRAPNSFKPDGSDVSEFSGRACRAHANAYESFPIIGGLLLFAIAASLTGVTNGLAYYLIAARILQTVVHLFSTSNIAVQVRFALFLAQLVICMLWIYQFTKVF